MTEIRKKLSILVFLGLTAGNAEATVIAPYAYANAVFDWNSFSVAGIPMGPGSSPSVSWSNLSTSATVVTQPANDYQSGVAADWIASLNKTSGDTSSWALANADATTLHTSSQVTHPSTTDGAWANGSRSGNLSVTGNGLLVFSMHYSLDAALIPDAGSPLNNSATAGVDFFAQKIGSSVHSEVFSANSALSLNSGNTNSSPVHQTGTLNLAILVNNGDQFNFLASSHAGAALGALQPIMTIGTPVSSVPLPGAAWLFLSTLVGFLGLSHRQSRLAA